MRTKGKSKSTALFLTCLLVIAFLAYSSAKGLVIGDYQIKPLSETIKRGLDLKGGISVVMEIQQDKVSTEERERTIELLSMRVNKMGVAETTITQEGAKRIRIDIPDKFDTKEVLDTVGKTGNLRFVGPDESDIIGVN